MSKQEIIAVQVAQSRVVLRYKNQSVNSGGVSNTSTDPNFSADLKL